jgi:hypothetical protein
MEFKFAELAPLKYGIQIKFTTLEGLELEMTYEELREIQETIRPFNPSAAALFPVYRLWLPILVILSPILDLERFQQVSSIYCPFLFVFLIIPLVVWRNLCHSKVFPVSSRDQRLFVNGVWN